LLAEVAATFGRDHPAIRVTTVSGGTGEILQLGRARDVDATWTHDPAAESTFVAEGHGAYRREIMYNDFVFAGPASDPAGLRGLRDAAEAMKRVNRGKHPFISRGDDSGTHRKELFLWKQAGLEVPGNGDVWYVQAGVGMGEALRIANTRRAYILTDRATLLTLKEQFSLEILVEGDPRLLNRYGLIRITDASNPESADSFAVWLSGPRGRAAIAEFGRARFGFSLFHPAQ